MLHHKITMNAWLEIGTSRPRKSSGVWMAQCSATRHDITLLSNGVKIACIQILIYNSLYNFMIMMHHWSLLSFTVNRQKILVPQKIYLLIHTFAFQNLYMGILVCSFADAFCYGNTDHSRAFDWSCHLSAFSTALFGI